MWISNPHNSIVRHWVGLFMSNERDQGEAVAMAFAANMVAGDFTTAFELLAVSLQKSLSPVKLCEEFESMLSYTDGQVTEVKVNDIAHDWPAKMPLDLCRAYIAINGDGFCEAVDVTVCREGERSVIREIIWGRP